jgi:uncharacterized membrane protein
MNLSSIIRNKSGYSNSLKRREKFTNLKLTEEGENSVLDRIHDDMVLLIAHASNSGKVIPPQVGDLLKERNFDNYFKAHEIICKAMEPATPETIKYLKRFKRKKTIFFSNIPLVRNFIIVALLAIASLMISGLSSEVNEETLSKGILNNHGISLLKNLIFLCSASAIGAVFFILSRLTKEVKQASLSVDDSTYYWAMLIMGMLSGLIMSEVIVLNQEIENQSVEMNRLLFALLGGFSSETVFSIMQGIMAKIRAVTAGD